MIYLLVILVLLGYTLNNLSKKYAHDKISIDRKLSKDAVEVGEEFQIIDIVENKKLLPVTFLRILEEVPMQLVYKLNTGKMDIAGRTVHEITMSLMPKQRIKRTYKACMTKRGRYVLNKTTVSVGDFLGTQTISRDYDMLQEIVAYPEAAHLETEIKPYGSYYGDISVQRWIINDPILNIGIREYTGNEPQKNIHWASSLRLGKLMVKNFDYTTDKTVMVVLNIESQKPFWAGIYIDQIERCISIARAVMEQLEQTGIQYGFSTNAQSGDLVGEDRCIPFGHGTAHFYDILEILGRMSFGINTTFEELLNNLGRNKEKNMTYILITPSILDEYVLPINNLCKHAQKTVLISINEKNLKGISKRVMTYTGKDERDERNS